MANDGLTLECLAKMRADLGAVLDLAERALRDQLARSAPLMPSEAVRLLHPAESAPEPSKSLGQCRSAWCTQHVPNGFLYCASCASSVIQVDPLETQSYSGTDLKPKVRMVGLGVGLPAPSMDPDPIPHVLGGES